MIVHWWRRIWGWIRIYWWSRICEMHFLRVWKFQARWMTSGTALFRLALPWREWQCRTPWNWFPSTLLRVAPPWKSWQFRSLSQIEEGAFEGCSSLTLRIPRSSKHARNPTYYCCRFVCTYAYAIICLVTAPFKGSKLCDLDIPGLEVGEVKWKDCTLHICVRQLLRVDFLKNF